MKASLEADLMRPWVVGSGGHSPPYGWIPAPRFHEDRLRGNDGRELQGLVPAGSPRVSLGPHSFSSPKNGGSKGVEKASSSAAIRIPGQVGDLTLTLHSMIWRMKKWKL